MQIDSGKAPADNVVQVGDVEIKNPRCTKGADDLWEIGQYIPKAYDGQ